jgi:hypothetical protein
MHSSTLGIRFDIGKAGEGYYGFSCWRVFWQAIHPADVGSASLCDGDTTATLSGQENIFCIVIQDVHPDSIRAIKTILSGDEGFKRICANPMFTEGAACEAEPLSDAGMIDNAGNLSGRTGASRSALEASTKDGSLARRIAKTSTGTSAAKARRRTAESVTGFPRLWKTVTLGLYTTEDYLRELETPPFVLGGFGDMPKMIKVMPVSRQKLEVKLALVSLRELGFIWSDRPRRDDVIRAAQERDLDLCPAEVGPALRLACRGSVYIGGNYYELPIAMQNVIVQHGFWFNRSKTTYGVFKLTNHPSVNGSLSLNKSDRWEPNIAHEHDHPIIFRVVKQSVSFDQKW